MCLAIFKPKGQKIPENEIISSWRYNSDGAGLCVRDNGAFIKKGFMSLNEYLAYILENEDYLLSHDVVFHLRYTTSGNTVPELTHPFPISSKNSDLLKLEFHCEKALIHNGVLFNPLFENSYSDTAIFSKWLSFFKPSKKKIESESKGNRLAIVCKDRVELIGHWHEISGIFYSNLYSIDFDDKKSDKFFWDYDSNFRDDIPFCPLCSSDEVENIGVYTDTCECLDCGTVFSTIEKNNLFNDFENDINSEDDFEENVLEYIKRG